jgi:hypothetical protein
VFGEDPLPEHVDVFLVPGGAVHIHTYTYTHIHIHI